MIYNDVEDNFAVYFEDSDATGDMEDVHPGQAGNLYDSMNIAETEGLFDANIPLDGMIYDDINDIFDSYHTHCNTTTGIEELHSERTGDLCGLDASRTNIFKYRSFRGF